jgi:hypothetical protein
VRTDGSDLVPRPVVGREIEGAAPGRELHVLEDLDEELVRESEDWRICVAPLFEVR